MIKFWKDDFRYVKKMGYNLYEYIYVFNVRGESSNYLRNKYSLQYPNIEVNLFTEDNSISVGSYKEYSFDRDITDMEEDDVKELLPLLQEK